MKCTKFYVVIDRLFFFKSSEAKKRKRGEREKREREREREREIGREVWKRKNHREKKRI